MIATKLLRLQLHDQRLTHLKVDSLEKCRRIADLTDYFKITNNISILNQFKFFYLQIILVLAVITKKSTKIFTFKLQK